METIKLKDILIKSIKAGNDLKQFLIDLQNWAKENGIEIKIQNDQIISKSQNPSHQTKINEFINNYKLSHEKK